MEEEVEIDEEKIREAVKKAEEVDIINLMRALIQMLKVYAELGKRIGTIQKENKDAFEAIGYLGSVAPSLIKALAKKSPPEEFGAFIKAFMDLLEVAPKLDKMMELPAEEKIEVGKQLEKIAVTLEEMVNIIEAKKKKGEG